MLSGDSTVHSFSFNGSRVEFTFDDNDSGKLYNIQVTTPIIYSEVTGGDGCVHMRIEATTDKLEINNKSGIFTLPEKFSQQMSAIRKGYHVIAGLKASEYPKVFLLVGDGTILLCPIKSESCISINIA